MERTVAAQASTVIALLNICHFANSAELKPTQPSLSDASFPIIQRVAAQNVTNGVDVAKLYAVSRYVEMEMGPSNLRDAMREMIGVLATAKSSTSDNERAAALNSATVAATAVTAHFRSEALQHSANVTSQTRARVHSLLDVAINFHTWATNVTPGSKPHRNYNELIGYRSRLSRIGDKISAQD